MLMLGSLLAICRLLMHKLCPLRFSDARGDNMLLSLAE